VEDFALFLFICDYFRAHYVVVRLDYSGCLAPCEGVWRPLVRLTASQG
jgi:hypothetical protein